MKNKDELKDLLNRLKGEVKDSSISELSELSDAKFSSGVPDASAYGPARQRGALTDGFESAPRAAGMAAAGQYADRPERFQAPGRPESRRPERAQGPEGANIIWSENKETMLFGILASLLAILGGVLAGLEYVILAGAASFLLFALVTVLTLLGYYLNFRREDPKDGSLAARVDQLSRRLEALSANGVPGQSLAGAQARDRELEQKVDELRMLVKSLSKAVEREKEI